MKKLLLKLGRGGEGYLFNLSAVIGCNNHGTSLDPSVVSCTGNLPIRLLHAASQKSHLPAKHLNFCWVLSCGTCPVCGLALVLSIPWHWDGAQCNNTCILRLMLSVKIPEL